MEQTVLFFKCPSPQYEKALILRDRILRKPLGLKFTPEELAKDYIDTHVGLFQGTTIIGCLTLSFTDDKRVKMRQVAIDETQQRRGFGKILSEAAEKFARDKGVEVIYCHARKEASLFYKKLGYVQKGEEFFEVNIPHYYMEKRLERNV